MDRSAGWVVTLQAVKKGEIRCARVGMFKSDHYEDISLAEWIAHTPHLVDQHLGEGQAMLDAIPKDKEVIRPR